MQYGCNSFPDELDRYMDNEMTNAERQAVINHLESCSKCREQLNDLQELDSLLKQVKELPEVEGDMQANWAALEAKLGLSSDTWNPIRRCWVWIRERFSKPTYWVPSLAATAAACTLIVFLSLPTREPVKTLSQVELQPVPKMGQVMILKTEVSKEPILWIYPSMKKQRSNGDENHI